MEIDIDHGNRHRNTEIDIEIEHHWTFLVRETVK